MSAGYHLRLRRGRLAVEQRREAIHPAWCHCAGCDPHRVSHQLRALNHWARLTFIGLALGLGLAWCVDAIVDGPGVLSIFGVRP